MPHMGKYCKAYQVKDLRQYPGWTEKTDNLRPMPVSREAEPQRRDALSADDVLYLQENFNVTDGVHIDAHIVFDDVTDDWIKYCQETLHFEVPDQARE